MFIMNTVVLVSYVSHIFLIGWLSENEATTKKSEFLQNNCDRISSAFQTNSRDFVSNSNPVISQIV